MEEAAKQKKLAPLRLELTLTELQMRQTHSRLKEGHENDANTD